MAGKSETQVRDLSDAKKIHVDGSQDTTTGVFAPNSGTAKIDWSRIVNAPGLATEEKDGFMSKEEFSKVNDLMRLKIVGDALQVEGVQGPKGETGQQGPEGPAGEAGAKGDPFTYSDFTPEQLEALKGPKGEKGDVGPAGPAGADGAKGADGEPGPIGPAGPKGDMGAPFKIKKTFASIAEMSQPNAADGLIAGDLVIISTDVENEDNGKLYVWDNEQFTFIVDLATNTAVQGPAGPKGEKGDPFKYSDFTEDQLAALKGPKGDKGEDGAPGPAGPAGEAGAKGADGEPGPKGETGPAGAAGPKGEDGKPFKIKKTFNSATAMQEPDASTGLEEGDLVIIAAAVSEEDNGKLFVWSGTEFTFIVDMASNTAVEGPAGPKGEKGDPFTYSDFTPEQLEGLKGPKGDAGPEGPRGETGPAGPAGAPGPKGEDGADGPQGPIGLTGPAGPAGEKGANGEPGPKGEAGPAGPAGAAGPAGQPGEKGADGKDADLTTQLYFFIPGNYGENAQTNLLEFNNQFYRWAGLPVKVKKLAARAGVAYQTTQSTLKLKVNGSEISAATVQPNAGSWIEVDLAEQNIRIETNQSVDFSITQGTGGEAKGLSIEVIVETIKE